MNCVEKNHTETKIVGLDEDAVTCPICMEMMNKKVFQCTEGHCICEKCYNVIRVQRSETKCPTCRVVMDKPIRCLTVENLFPHLVLKCQNNTHGCNFKGTESERKTHLKKCTFNRITCSESGCAFDGTPKDYFIHWISTHGRPFEMQKDRCMKLGRIECIISESILDESDNLSKTMETEIVVYKNDVLVMFKLTFYFNCKGKKGKWIEIKPRIMTEQTDKEDVHIMMKMIMWKGTGESVTKMIKTEGLNHLSEMSFKMESSCDETISIFDVQKMRLDVCVGENNEFKETEKRKALNLSSSSPRRFAKRVKRECSLAHS